MSNATTNIEKTGKTTNPSTGAILRKKLNAEIVKTADMKNGDKFQGVFVSYTDRPWLDKKTGEEKMIPQFSFHAPGNPDLRTVLLADNGFKNCFFNADVQKGDWIEVVKLEMKDLDGGRRVNQYDIFQLSN